MSEKMNEKKIATQFDLHFRLFVLVFLSSNVQKLRREPKYFLNQSFQKSERFHWCTLGSILLTVLRSFLVEMTNWNIPLEILIFWVLWTFALFLYHNKLLEYKQTFRSNKTYICLKWEDVKNHNYLQYKGYWLKFIEI